MEEVWKNKNLSSLQHQTSSTDDPYSAITFRGTNFQDFLAKPFDKDGKTTLPADYNSPAPPATMLSLNSGSEFSSFENSNPQSQINFHQPTSHASGKVVNHGLCSCGNIKKRFPPDPESSENSSGDRRHKRMMKNRESAARSRARKQAYTNELEVEVSHLMEENARLKQQQRQLLFAAAAQQLPRKHALYRTSTAPF